MKFKFKLETLLKQRKIEQDLAQREYAEAQYNVRKQLSHIQYMYEQIDITRMQIDEIQARDSYQVSEISSLEYFIDGQKIAIENAKKVARDLMAIEEEKHEVLVEKMQNYKVLDKLKENKLLEFKKLRERKLQKQSDDMVTMRFVPEVK